MASQSTKSATKPTSKSGNKSGTNSAVAYSAVQCGLAVIFFGIWVVVSMGMSGENMLQPIITALPYLCFFILGVLSRYVPGVKGVARRLKSAMPG